MGIFERNRIFKRENYKYNFKSGMIRYILLLAGLVIVLKYLRVV